MAFDGLGTGPKFFVQKPQGPITMMVMIMTMRLGIWSIFWHDSLPMLVPQVEDPCIFGPTLSPGSHQGAACASASCAPSSSRSRSAWSRSWLRSCRRRRRRRLETLVGEIGPFPKLFPMFCRWSLRIAGQIFEFRLDQRRIAKGGILREYRLANEARCSLHGSSTRRVHNFQCTISFYSRVSRPSHRASFFHPHSPNLRKDRKEEQEVDAEERSTDGLMTHAACGLEEKKER